MALNNTLKLYGKRSFWSTFFAAGAFTCALVCSYYVFFPDNPISRGWLFITAWLIGGGILFGQVTDYEIDIENARYRVTKRLFFKLRSSWKYLEDADFVSLDKKRYSKFKVNIWYQDKKKALIADFKTYEAALEFATKASEALDTELINYNR